MSELNQIIGKARQDIDLEEQQSRQRSPRRHFNSKPLVLVLVIVAVAVWGNNLLSRNLDEETIREDLTTMAIQAGDSILTYYGLQKVLPPSIPDPSLRSLLRYQVVDAESQPPEFVLEGEINGVPVTWRYPATEGQQ